MLRHSTVNPTRGDLQIRDNQDRPECVQRHRSTTSRSFETRTPDGQTTDLIISSDPVTETSRSSDRTMQSMRHRSNGFDVFVFDVSTDSGSESWVCHDADGISEPVPFSVLECSKLSTRRPKNYPLRPFVTPVKKLDSINLLRFYVWRQVPTTVWNTNWFKWVSKLTVEVFTYIVSVLTITYVSARVKERRVLPLEVETDYLH